MNPQQQWSGAMADRRRECRVWIYPNLLGPAAENLIKKAEDQLSDYTEFFDLISAA